MEGYDQCATPRSPMHSGETPKRLPCGFEPASGDGPLVEHHGAAAVQHAFETSRDRAKVAFDHAGEDDDCPIDDNDFVVTANKPLEQPRKFEAGNAGRGTHFESRALVTDEQGCRKGSRSIPGETDTPQAP